MSSDYNVCIAGMFTGIQMTLFSFAETLENKGVATRAELAAGLRSTALDIPMAPVQETVQYMLNLLAKELECSVDPGSDPAEARRRMFQLIKGGLMQHQVEQEGP